ncbi:MAG: efflux RND transporter periplasmic adaptor subunit [Alloprevotella sp.]
MKFPFLRVAVLLTAPLLWSCHAPSHDEHGDHDPAEKEETHADDEILLTSAQLSEAGIRTETLRPGTFAEVVEVSGKVMPTTGGEQTVCATLAGVVSLSSALTEGTTVKAGQPLFHIDASRLADGNPAAVARAELLAAEQALERAEKLFREDLISRSELEEARRRHSQAASTVTGLGGSQRSRGVGAPMAGFVKSLLVQPGAYVELGQPLAVISQDRRLLLRADVPLRHSAFLSSVRTASFRLSSDREARSLDALNGKLVARGGSADASAANCVPVTFSFDNSGDMVAGSAAQVWLKGNERSGVLTVPNSALVEAQGLFFVYVQLHAGAFSRREVKVGATDGLRTEITEGLKSGETVVTSGSTRLRMAENAGAVPAGHSH